MKSYNREKLIEKLESVQPGLSTRDVVEQSSCFVFKDGYVMTFNDEIACMVKCDLGFVGAVPSKGLLDILRKLSEDEITIESSDSSVILKGKRKEIELTLEAQITLPISEVDRPKTWKQLDENFLDGIELVQHCASGDDAHFALTCIHISPTFIEACDNSQMARVSLKTGVDKSFLVRRNSIKHITSLQVNEMSESDSWIHFRNPSQVVISCRRFNESYHDLNGLLAFEGKEILLPKGLSDAADKAGVFVSDDAEGQIMVNLKAGKIRVSGKGAMGRYKEFKSIKYDGPDLAFMIAPTLLMDVAKKFNKAEITSQRLKIQMGKMVYVTCLSQLKDA